MDCSKTDFVVGLGKNGQQFQSLYIDLLCLVAYFKQNGCSICLGISPVIAEFEPEFSSSPESDLFHYRFATDWRWLSSLASVEIRVVTGPSDDCPFFCFQLS